MYKSADPFTLCKESLLNFLNLQNYLEINGYRYRFTNFINFWDPTIESTVQGDYSLGHFAKNMEIYKNFDFTNWFFIDDLKNGLYEYAKKVDELDIDEIGRAHV